MLLLWNYYHLYHALFPHWSPLLMNFCLNVSISSVFGITGWSTNNSEYFSFLWFLLDNTGPKVSQPIGNISLYVCVCVCVKSYGAHTYMHTHTKILLLINLQYLTVPTFGLTPTSMLYCKTTMLLCTS